MAKQLYSKRNRVVQSGKIVCKTVKTQELAKAEALRLRLLKKRGVPTPVVLASVKNNIILKYVDGIPIPDWLSEQALTKENLHSAAESLASWLDRFYKGVRHSQTHIILQDTNCRNFLVCYENRICGLDFESFAHGTREENVGEILAFIQGYDLCQSNRDLFSQYFLKATVEGMKLDVEKVVEGFKLSKLKLENRRKNI